MARHNRGDLTILLVLIFVIMVMTSLVYVLPKFAVFNLMFLFYYRSECDG